MTILTESSAVAGETRPQALKRRLFSWGGASVGAWDVAGLGGLLGGLLAVVDVFTHGQQFGWQAVLGALGTGLALASVVGVAVALVVLALPRARPWLRRLALLVVALLAASAVLVPMRVWQDFGGKDQQLAWFLLGGSVALGLGIAVLIGALRQIVSSARRLRWVWLRAFGAACLVAVTLWVDRNYYPDRYEPVHLQLRFVAWLGILAIAAAGLVRFRAKLRGYRQLLLLMNICFIIAGFLYVEHAADSDMLALMKAPWVRVPIEAFRTASDVDRDGFAAVLGGGDCSPFDSKVSPSATEIPNNGVDDNCLGGDYQGRSPGPPPSPPVPQGPSPTSVVLITVDTLRADRMSLYGAPRQTTPRLERWAQTALKYERAYTPAPWTSLALSALHRGVYPRRLSWTWVLETNRMRLLPDSQLDELRAGERPVKAFTMPIDDGYQTLAELLARRGMATSAVLDDGGSSFLEPELNMAGELHSYQLMDEQAAAERNDRGVTRLAMAQLRQLMQQQRPFFLWVHYYGPHQPATNHSEMPRYGDALIDKYDHEVGYLDRWLGRLLQEIDSYTKDTPIAVAVTSDHGERIEGAVRGHGNQVDLTSLHVPLLVRGPRIEPGTFQTPVSTLDLFATVLDWTETPAPTDLDSHTLVARPDAPRAPILAETWRFSRARAPFIDKLTALDAHYRLEWDLLHNTREAYRITERAEVLANDIEAQRLAPLEAVLIEYLEQNRPIRVKE